MTQVNRWERMQAVADGYVSGAKFSGIEWQVQVAGEVRSAGRVGYADSGAQTPIPESAIYRVFSMTKPVVSLLALMLVERGQLRLYDMVAQYDQRFAAMRVLTPEGALLPAARPLTVEDLLTHRAGFTYEFLHGCHIAQYYREAEINADGHRSLDDMMDALAGLPLAFQPGSQWRYSVSIDVLAHVIECAANRPLDELLKELIFDPLDMQDTAFCVPADKLDRLMSMYGVNILSGLPPLQIAPQVLEPLDVEAIYPVDKPETFRRGGLGLFSTLKDYSAFAHMLLDGKAPDGAPIVSRKMHEMLRSNRIPAAQLPMTIGPNALHGYGWGLIGRVLTDTGRAMGLSGGGEFGWAGAATTYFWADPAERMSGVVMSQFMGASLPLTDDMRTAAYQALA